MPLAVENIGKTFRILDCPSAQKYGIVGYTCIIETQNVSHDPDERVVCIEGWAPGAGFFLFDASELEEIHDEDSSNH